MTSNNLMKVKKCSNQQINWMKTVVKHSSGTGFCTWLVGLIGLVFKYRDKICLVRSLNNHQQILPTNYGIQIGEYLIWLLDQSAAPFFWHTKQNIVKWNYDLRSPCLPLGFNLQIKRVAPENSMLGRKKFLFYLGKTK